ncbi:MAG: hypothetical protein U1D55_09305 [Phycisphaerae bacterium]
MTRITRALAGLLPVVVAGCGIPSERNPFLTFTEEFGLGVLGTTTSNQGTGAQGATTTGTFRRTMTITLANNSPSGQLRTSLAAWVNPSSIRTADQQDALLTGGYVQLTQEVRLGSAFSLPAGTFVFNGGGIAGAIPVRLDVAAGPLETSGTQGAITPVTQQIDIITPDVVLVFLQPPEACDTIAFVFEKDGEPLPSAPISGVGGIFSGATGLGSSKTLAQVDVYQCLPLMPGVFLKTGGGAKQSNEYFEGENLRFDFFRAAAANGDACTVTISQ